MISKPTHNFIPFLFSFVTLVVFVVGCSHDDGKQTTTPANSTSQTEIDDLSLSTGGAADMGTETVPGLGESEFIAPLRDAYDRIDPAADGWQSEALSEAATKELSRLSHAIEMLGNGTTAALSDFVTSDFVTSDFVASDFSSVSLRPKSLRLEFDADGLAIHRMPASQRADVAESYQGPDGLGQAIGSWLESVKASSDPHVKLKLVRVDPGDGGMTSSVLCTLSCDAGGAKTQINSTWKCGWVIESDQPLSLKLKSIEVESYEEVVAAAKAPQFVDCANSIMGSNACWQDQFLRGTDYWRARIPRDFGLDVAANHGLALGDVNGDHLDDLFICQQGGLPNRLFLQNPDGTLRDVTSESGVGWLDYCASALMIDLDNDGDRDLAISQDFRLLVMENDGTGKFEFVFGIGMNAQSFSMAAADYDVDGDLDLYICGYNPSAAGQRSGAMGEPLPFHDANNGGRNTLWRNDGNFQFSDVTAASGLNQNNSRFSFAASWEDFDNDGDLDLYVANDYGRNNLYRNDGARFTDIASGAGVEDTSNGMSVSWADCNRDGRMDLYVSNMFSGAGNRITYQRQFKAGQDENVLKQFQRMARGNTLFLGDPDGGFRDLSEETAVTMGRWAWGSRFADINNDGWEDILVVNGFITAADTDDL